jgi:ferric-dicitrate binding protein FerR (iron transport regulator)
MEKQRLTYLLQQHLANMATEPEQRELAAMLKADEHRELFNTVLVQMMQESAPALPQQTERWQKMVQDIVHIDKIAAQPVRAGIRVITIYKWAAAAAIVLLAGTGVFYLMNRTKHAGEFIAENNKPALDSIPVNKNMLTLADGSRIVLDSIPNGKIAVQENTTITKQDEQIVYASKEAQGSTWYNVISTARAQKYEVVLPDGSHVWLNAASSIRFPASFSASERTVELTGEAFFDVQHADKIPFRIHSGNITTSVLGTAFDINAYPGQKAMMVSVKRGRVKVQTGNATLATLQKGEQVHITANLTTRQSSIDTLAIAGWLQGSLYYKDQALADIIADLQRVYNVTIQIKRPSLLQVMTTVSFNKETGVQKALEIICRITDSRLSKNNEVFIIE